MIMTVCHGHAIAREVSEKAGSQLLGAFLHVVRAIFSNIAVGAITTLRSPVNFLVQTARLVILIL